MVILANLPQQFYAQVRGQLHVLVLAAVDVDAVCAWKILQTLFRADNVQYTFVSVEGKKELESGFKEHADQVKSVVLINCGGTFDLLQLLQPDNDDTQFYIFDSRRPLDVDNVYNQDQVHVVLWDEEEISFPEFDDIYASDMDSDDDEVFSDEEERDTEEGHPASKKRRTETPYERRRRKHLWKKRREQFLFKYKEFSCHGTASSLVMFELAWKLSRDSKDIVWWGIIGLTEQYLHEKIDRETYVSGIHRLQPQVLRLNRSDDDTISSINSLRITFENELRLVLYRHWTLYDSLTHSTYTSCKFKVWTMKGQKKLLEFLADMGLPLVQSKQKYSAMDMEIKENLREWLVTSARKYNLDDMTYGTFVAQLGYRHQVCAADMVHCVSALLDSQDKGGFLVAVEALTRGNMEVVHKGIELAKQQQTAIVSQVNNLIDMHQVIRAGPFLYACMDEGASCSKHFSCPVTLGRLVRFLRDVWIMHTKKAKDLPFVVCTMPDTSGNCLTIGVPAYADDTHKSEFHRAFVAAAQRIQSNASFNYFNGSAIDLPTEDRGQFIDALSSLFI